MQTVCMTAVVYDSIPLAGPEDESPVMPFRFIADDGREMVRGFAGEPEPQLVLRVPDTAEERLRQVQAMGMNCHACQERLPTREIMMRMPETETQEARKAALYLCDKCHSEARGNRRKRISTGRPKPPPRGSVKAKRKRDRANRRRGRK